MIGTTLSHYKILSVLGKGGMGEVYLAEDTRLKRRVALKLLPAGASDPVHLERFRREAETVAALSHPNIVTIHSVEEADDVHFLTMELVEGTPLDRLLEQERLPLPRLFELAVPLAGALAAAHEKGIIHRDLKPANLIVTPDGHLKVLDFGLAKVIETVLPAAGDPNLSTHLQVSHEGLVLGTVPYMSPEQAQGKPVDARSDIFSFGTLLYEMVAGRRPFGGNSSAEIISSILKDNPAPAVAPEDAIPNHLTRIIRRCLEKDPIRRYQTARDLQNDLRDLQREVELDSASRISATAAPPRNPGRRGPWIGIGIMIGLATVGVGGWFLAHQGGAAMDSIAVLPFVNTGGDPETEYLVDGVTESLIDRLSELPDFRIMARNTVFRFKDSGKDPQEIGRELGVAAVLSGRVDLRGETLVIGTELIQVADGSQIWGERFNRPMDDLLQVEAEISRTLADKLELKLSGTQKENLDRALDVDPEAYRAYLRGIYYWNRRTQEDLERGNELFREAIRLDPDFALAYAGLANGYLVLGNWGFIDPAKARAEGKKYALRALEIDPTVAEAHAALGGMYSEHEWNWARAEEEFRAALELKPGYATGHQWYAEFLSAMGREREAREQAERALELDPLSLIVQIVSAISRIGTGDWDRFVADVRAIQEADPEFQPAANACMQGALAMGRTRELLAGALEVARQAGFPDTTLARMRAAADRMDVEAFHGISLATYEGAARDTYVSPLTLAAVGGLAGDRDKAFAYLEEAYRTRTPGLIYLRVPGQFPDNLKSDPRWDALVERMHFPPVPEAAGS